MQYLKIMRPMMWIIAAVYLLYMFSSVGAQDKPSGVTCSEVNYTLAPDSPTITDEQAIRTHPTRLGQPSPTSVCTLSKLTISM